MGGKSRRRHPPGLQADGFPSAWNGGCSIPTLTTASPSLPGAPSALRLLPATSVMGRGVGQPGPQEGQ